jgi:transcriptional regulator with XRE-family HTH domain
MNSMMMSITSETFGAMLKRLRTSAQLSLRDLGQQADIPHSAIAAIEAGRQNIGIKQAEKLADVLKPHDRGSFLMKAVSTTKRERILPFANRYHAEVLNAVAIYLAHAGISPEDIASCCFARPPYNESDVDGMFVTRAMGLTGKGSVHRVPITAQRKPLPGPDLVLQMKNGKRYALIVEARTLQ